MLVILLLTNSKIFCQDIVDTTKLWSNVINKLPSWIVMTEYIKFDNDTMIDLKTYKKVLRSTDEFHNNWSIHGFIRETVDKRVYFRADTSHQEYLLYDFDVFQNDTINIFFLNSYANDLYLSPVKYKISLIDSIYISNEYRKQIHLNIIFDLDPIGYECDHWIEGIGSIKGILHGYDEITPSDSYRLLCYSENNILKYQNPNFISCYYIWTGIDIIDNTSDILIYPNPIINISQLSIPSIGENHKLTIKIFNSIGQRIKINEFNGIIDIHKNNFKTGIYYFMIANDTSIIKTGNFMIK